MANKVLKARKVSFTPNARTPEWATRDAWARDNYKARTAILRACGRTWTRAALSPTRTPTKKKLTASEIGPRV